MKTYKQLIVGEKKYFDSCHGSNICYLSNNTIMVVWFAGSKEGAEDVQIWGAIRTGTVWGEPKVITKEEGIPHWNPVLFEVNESELVLFYKLGPTIATWQTMIQKSYDYGKTWTDPEEMVPGDIGGRGPVRNKLIKLRNQRILAPSSLENGEWRSYVDYSDDFGKTWLKSNEVIAVKNEKRIVSDNPYEIPVSEQSYIGRGVIQPTLWESNTGVHMFMRSSEGFIYRSDSTDNGTTFCAAYPTAMPNNNSGIDAVVHSDNQLYLVYNPVEINWGKRCPLILAKSMDNGQTFETMLVLEGEDGEFSYPSILSRNHTLYLSYTYNRHDIAYWEITI